MPSIGRFFLLDIPEQYQAEANDAREKLLNAVSLHDDGIAELLLEGKPVPEDQLRKAIRKATLEMKINPVAVGSSFKYVGVQNLVRLRRQRLILNPGERGVIKCQTPVRRVNKSNARRSMKTDGCSCLQDGC